MSMEKNNTAILNHFYSLLIEMNFYTPSEDVFSENKYIDDPFIQKHLQQIRLKTSKYKAQLNKDRYAIILAEIKRLKDLGFDEIKKILQPHENIQLQPLFRRFEELSSKDEASIAEDEELLKLIQVLKDKLDEATDE
jgi:hypothetical protein